MPELNRMEKPVQNKNNPGVFPDCVNGIMQVWQGFADVCIMDRRMNSHTHDVHIRHIKKCEV